MSPKRELLHEWMHRFEGKDTTIRVWTQRAGTNAEFLDQRIRLNKILAFADVDQILTEIPALPWVNAVEVLDESGNGRLVYVDWP